MGRPVLLRLRPSGAPGLAERILLATPEPLSHAAAQALVDEGHGPYSAGLGTELGKLGWDVRELVLGVPALIDAWEADHGPLPKARDRTEGFVLAAIRRWQPSVLIDTNVKFLTPQSTRAARDASKSLQLTIATLGQPKNFGRALAADMVLAVCPSLMDPLRAAGARSAHVLRHAFNPSVLNELDPSAPHREIIFSGSIGAFGQGSRSEHLDALLASTPIECWVSERLASHSPSENLTSVRPRGRSTHTQIPRAAPLIRATSALYRATGRGERRLDDALQAHTPAGANSPAWARQTSLKEHFPGRIHEPVHGLDMYRLLSSAKVVFHHGVDNIGNCGGALRIFETTGVGTALLVDRTHDISRIFEPESEVATYGSIEECVSLARVLLMDERTREDLARAGQRRTLRDHTFAARARELNDILRDAARW
jgi:spore maturation protein CgeB